MKRKSFNREKIRQEKCGGGNVAACTWQKTHVHNLQDVLIIEKKHKEADDKAHRLVIVAMPERERERKCVTFHQRFGRVIS